MKKTFEHSKEIIKQVERGIKTFDMGKQTCLLTDWSKTGIGLKLQINCDCEPLSPHCCPDGWGLVFASSRFLTSAESRYWLVKGECLAAVWAMEKAKYFLLGCKSFLLATDHKPLLGILSDDKSIEDVENPRLQRLKEKTLRFRFAICHVAGKLNKVAEAALRLPTSLPEERDTISQLDCIFSEHRQQEIQQSLDIKQEVLGLSEAAVYSLYMANKPRPASILDLHNQVITWSEVKHPAEVQ